MISDFLAFLFYSRDYAHRAHLKTKSDPEHTTLGTFYEELTDLIDVVSEAYQGRHGRIDIPYRTAEVEDGDSSSILRKHLKIIEGVRFKAIDREDSALQSLIDDIVTLYLTTLYRLTLT